MLIHLRSCTCAMPSLHTLPGECFFYWKWLGAIPAIEVLCHRVVWCLLFYSILLAWRREGVFSIFRLPGRIWIRIAASAILLAVNWFLYIWSVNHGRIIEASLGYFINLLFNVALGIGFLKERLTVPRWAALTLAFSGVVWLTIQNGGLPWDPHLFLDRPFQSDYSRLEPPERGGGGGAVTNLPDCRLSGSPRRCKSCRST